MPTSLTRRSVLGAGLALGAAGPLAACSPAPAPPTTPPSARAELLPAYRRFDGVTADIAGTGDGVPDAFLAYPGSPRAVIADKPASTPIRFLCANDGVTPPPMTQNTFWQGLNERLGTTLSVETVPGTDYDTKLSAVLAGGDLPDVVQLNLNIPRLSELLPKRFVDLSSHLSGAAVDEYPMLANLPTIAWQNVTINGGLYGVPYPSVLPDSLLFARADIAEKLGVSLEPKSAEEFVEMCTALTDESERRWALGSGVLVLKWVLEMFGAPNQWRIETDGRFTRMWETPEYRQAVEFTADLYRRGLFHPNSFLPAAGTGGFFNSGQLLVMSAGIMWWPNFYRDAADVPGFRVAPIMAPRHDGSGRARKYLLNGMYTFAGIRAGSSPDRIREILRVQNYLAAPFGSAEHLYRTYGQEGVHHTRVDGNPVLTAKGQAEVTPLTIRFMSGSPTVIFTAGRDEETKLNHQLQQELIADGLPLPTVGLISSSQTSKGSSLDRAVNDVVADIIQGRRTIDTLDQQAKKWRSDGGDKIAEEYQAAKASR